MAPVVEHSHKRVSRSASGLLALSADEPARKKQEHAENPEEAAPECPSLTPLLPHLPTESK